MDLQRLKFAWARGARLQVQIKPEFDRGDEWSREYNCPSSTADMNLARYNWRVHPKDEDLQYGPLSTALREMALYRTLFDRWTVERCYQDAACKLVESFDPRGMHADLEDDVTLPTFLLFYAELLADEGL